MICGKRIENQPYKYAYKDYRFLNTTIFTTLKNVTTINLVKLVLRTLGAPHCPNNFSIIQYCP